MRLSLDCGLSFKFWWIATVTVEILFSLIIAGFGGWEYMTNVGADAMLLYTPKPKTDYHVNNERYTILVTCWILLVLVGVCAIRICSSILLTLGIKRASADVAKYWIAFKMFTTIMSLFLVTASFTVSDAVKIATLISLMTDLLTSYFTRILLPELDKMRKFIVMVDPEPESEKQDKEEGP